MTDRQIMAGYAIIPPISPWDENYRSRMLMGALVNLSDPDKVYVSGSDGLKGQTNE